MLAMHEGDKMMKMGEYKVREVKIKKLCNVVRQRKEIKRYSYVVDLALAFVHTRRRA